MNKNLIWKLLLIVVLTALAAWRLYPPNKTLKQGLDLAGGTSLIYEIDTTGMSAAEQKNLAQTMIPILLKRVDPTHMANIVMRPQGDTRIEIQLPFSGLDTREKRKAYEQALLTLEDQKLDLLEIKQVLSFESDQRTAYFEKITNGREDRLEILNSLATIYDQRTEKQIQRDTLTNSMEQLLTSFQELGGDQERLRSAITFWISQKPDQQTESIDRFLKDQFSKTSDAAAGEKLKQARGIILKYIELYDQWAPVVNALTQPEDGLNTQWNQAYSKLQQLRLETEQLREVLDLPMESTKRNQNLAKLKESFPEYDDQIEAIIATYAEYKKVGGYLDDPEDLKRMLKGAGVLEFRILPILGDTKSNPDELQAYVEALQTRGPTLASDNRYKWCEIEDPVNWKSGGVRGEFGDKQFVLASNQPNEAMLPNAEKPWKLNKAYPTVNQRDGTRAIGFMLDQTAANLFFNITSNNLERQLCILLDGRAISAPGISSAIRSEGIITGTFTPTEQSDLVNKLNAGSLRAKLSEVPISEKTIGPLIGGENRDRGIKAGIIGLITVAVFMLIYYLVAGGIADIALMLNILFVLALMAGLNATFTLPGIAGLILTIGMSVDANVLIFERIREEQKRGSSIRAAISNGYSRALSTILDANITTFGVAAILLMVASEEIKGFAIVLMLGILCSMFTALFVTRIIFDFLISRRLLTNHISMFGMLQNTSINWMSLRPAFMLISAVLIITGLSVFFTRDDSINSKYDIEFTGGTSVQIDLKQSAGFTREQVEQRFRKYAEEELNNKALAAARVYSIDQGEEQSGLQYEISTTETNKSTVTVTFSEAGKTVEDVTQTLIETAEKLDQNLAGLEVLSIDVHTFQISTNRVNKALVQDVLNNAFSEKAEVSEVQVNEIVSDAVREAFKDLLAVQENLRPEILTLEEITAATPVLGDFLGGLKIECKLGIETTVEELSERISNTRFKTDMQSLRWYNYKILKSNLTEPALGEKLNEFVYVSVHPDAAYRSLEQNEWDNFVNNEKAKLLRAASLESSLSRVTQIDPSIGAQSKVRALLAIFLSLLAIIGYIWMRFGTARYGVAAIAALVHDVCITLGVVTACTYIAGKPLGDALGIGDFKINLEMIAAFLTIIGYSLNDTIVVFDRIRENRGKSSSLNPMLINNSINQTLSRTLLTSFTTFLVVLIMYIWGGTGLRGFTFAMLIGILIGTYSSIAIAAPILLIGEKGKK